MSITAQRSVMMRGLDRGSEVRLTGRFRGRYVVPWDTKTVMIGGSVKVAGSNARAPIVPPIARRHRPDAEEKSASKKGDRRCRSQESRPHFCPPNDAKWWYGS